jgi:hypothetical protein
MKYRCTTGCGVRKNTVCNVYLHARYVRSALKNCPCDICLVKSMCRIKCITRKNYFRDVCGRSTQYKTLNGLS